MFGSFPLGIIALAIVVGHTYGTLEGWSVIGMGVVLGCILEYLD